MQVFELFLHLAVPGGLGVEAEIAKGGFHIRSGMGYRRGLQRPTGLDGRILSRLRFKMVGGFAQAQPGLLGDGGNGAAGKLHMRVEAGSHRRAAERQLTQMRADTRAR